MAGSEQLPIAIPDDLRTEEEIREFIRKEMSRRKFMVGMGVAGLGAVALQYGCASSPNTSPGRQVFVANATGLILADPTNCVGCRRCESACVAFNQGNYARGNNPATVATTSDDTASTMTQPSISNIKVNRNLQYGTDGAKAFSANTGGGLFGSFTVVANTCNQCPHPVPCQLSCPSDAIQVVGPANARVVNTAECIGCGTCVKACPWEMTALDGPVLGANTKSHKCHLCAGLPECVAACPASALTYVPWTDVTRTNPARQSTSGVALAAGVADTCKKCH
jgi:Fe-S-cluster-containing hydrogenase component 2